MLPDADLPPISNVEFMTKRVCVLGVLPMELEGAQVVRTRYVKGWLRDQLPAQAHAYL